MYILTFLNILFSSDIDEDVQSLVQFSTELTVEAVARCIKTINANSDVPHKLPPSMSARFQIGSKLANALQVKLIYFIFVTGTSRVS